MSDKKKFSGDKSPVLEEVVIDESVEAVQFEEPDEEVVSVEIADEMIFTDIEDEKSSAVSSTDEEVLTDYDLKKDENAGKKKFYLSVYDLVSIIMSSFIIIAVIFVFAFRLVGVDGESMTNTLQHGDWLLTTTKSEYVQGDIVVITQDNYFQAPLIKRVIAVGGQTVDINYDTATVYVDGVALEEPYVRENYLIKKMDYREFPYTVPEGYLFCMGDNRNGSSDSRSSLVGPIDEREILGKAFVRILPFGNHDIYDYE